MVGAAGGQDILEISHHLPGIVVCVADCFWGHVLPCMYATSGARRDAVRTGACQPAGASRRRLVCLFPSLFSQRAPRAG
jgi:hypothetical protein